MARNRPDSAVQEQRDEYDPYKFDRPRGVITERDRKYLCGVSDVEPKSHHERRVREEIRERVLHANLDYAILAYNLSERDRDLIRDKTGRFRDAAKHQIAFQFFANGYNYGMFHRPIELGVKRGMWRDGYDVDVDVEFDVRFDPSTGVPDETMENVDETVEQSSKKQLRDMLYSGIITDEQFAEEIQRRKSSE